MVARRTVLGAVIGVTVSTALDAAPPADAAVTVAGRPAAPAGADPGWVPRTRAAWQKLEDGRLRVPKATFRLSHLGITWRGANAHVRLRTASGWGRWLRVRGCGGGPDGRGRRGGSALLVVPATIGYEVSVGGSGTANITELNTVDGPLLQTSAGQLSAMPLPDGTACAVTYLSRAAWGADESLRFAKGQEIWPPEYRAVQALTVHHTAGANNDPDPAATVRAIYYYQTVTLGWGDIGYHLMIDESGRVYEARASGSDTSPVYGPSGSDGRPMMVVGGHVQGFNSGNIGVCLLGNFTSKYPTAAAQDALVRVLASLARLGRLDPQATITYKNPDSGATKTVHTISGHRDWAATQCPGDLFYPKLTTIRDSVASSMYQDGLLRLPRPTRSSL